MAGDSVSIFAKLKNLPKFDKNAGLTPYDFFNFLPIFQVSIVPKIQLKTEVKLYKLASVEPTASF